MNTNKLIIAAILVAVAVGLWIALRPLPEPAPVTIVANEPNPVVASLPALQPSTSAAPQESQKEEGPTVDLRLLAVTLSKDQPSASRATLQNVLNLPGIAVMAEGDVFPDDEEIKLLAIESKRVLLDDHGEQRYLDLDPENVLARPDPYAEEVDLDPDRVLGEMQKIAERGLRHEDMMSAVWRNIGRREKPFVLVQGRVAPHYGEGKWPDVPMLGLRVHSFMPGSFWEQLGLQVDDIILAIDGVRIDSNDQWTAQMPVLYQNEFVSLWVEREGESFTLETSTVPPR